MPIGYVFLFGALVGFGLLGIFHKVADHPSCRPRMVTMLLLLCGAVLTGLYTAFFDAKGLHLPPKVLAIGAAGGMLSSLALFAFQASLRFGKISTSWLIINLCVSVPVILSIVVYRERVTAGKAVGMLLVLIAILLLWWDKKQDLERAGAEGRREPATSEPAPETEPPVARVRDLELEGGGGVGTMAAAAAAAEPRVLSYTAVEPIKSKSKWLPLIMLAFLANGLAASSQKVLVELGGGDYAWQFYTVLYAAGFALFAIVSLMNAGRPNRREFATASIMAVASVAGNICIVKALDNNVPGSVAYPVGNGGSLFLVVLAGVLLFKERVHPVGLAGIAVGIAAVLVLIMS
jgi:drug/metabolite transporter (DMT)-like permease